MLAEKLKRRGLVSSAISLVILAVGAFPAQTEVVLNFGSKADAQLSRNASYTLLTGTNVIFSAIATAEASGYEKAIDQVRLGISQLEKARQLFIELQKRVGSMPVDVSKVALSKQQVDRILGTHKIELPRTTDALAQLAITEMNRFLGVTRELSFANVQKARADTLAFSSAINRMLDVGVLVSALAETETNPR